jgi:hypothetical protein
MEQAKPRQPNKNPHDSYISDFFRNGAKLFLDHLEKVRKSKPNNGIDALKLYREWVSKKNYGFLEKRWIRAHVYDKLIESNDETHKRYARRLKLKPTRFDNARKN